VGSLFNEVMNELLAESGKQKRELEKRLALLSRAVANALEEYRELENTNSAPRSGWTAFDELENVYREHGKQD
jgi:hypothetical protein